MKDLAGRVAVVTGGASGIGRGMAEAFADDGMKLVLADIEAEVLEKTVDALAAQGAEVIGVQCDVSDEASVASLREQTLNQYGAVHVLCNNAGVAGGASGSLWEAALDDWNWVMGVNLMGVIHGIRSFVPAMIEQGGPAHVVNTSSIAGVIHGAGIYGVTKHAVVALSEGLFSDFRIRQLPIGVSVLCPGWVRTNIMESERNRPEGPRPAPGDRSSEIEMMRKVVAELVDSGLDPKDVGKLVADSIRQERFYVFPHPHWSNMIENRMQSILQGRDPVNVPPAGETLWPTEPE